MKLSFRFPGKNNDGKKKKQSSFVHRNNLKHPILRLIETCDDIGMSPGPCNAIWPPPPAVLRAREARLNNQKLAVLAEAHVIPDCLVGIVRGYCNDACSLCPEVACMVAWVNNQWSFLCERCTNTKTSIDDKYHLSPRSDPTKPLWRDPSGPEPSSCVIL